MVYAFTCPRGCGEKEVDRPVADRGREVLCKCGAAMRRAYKVAVIIPPHMKARHDNVVRAIMPQEPEYGKEARVQWLKNAQAMGLNAGRYRHDLE